MIAEDYVSFEIAKLLKDKGFDLTKFHGKWAIDYDNVPHAEDFPEGEIIVAEWKYPLITLQMAMKWLREIQALNIYARPVWKDVEVQYGDWEPAVVGYNWLVESLIDNTYSKMSIESFLTYEEACEAAIKYCLENLI